ncbi:MAG: carbon monoxide dehydrogenase, partial [Bacillota bacterium]
MAATGQEAAGQRVPVTLTVNGR